jgi:hypothetical protein
VTPEIVALVDALAWPVAALLAVCCAIGGGYAIRHPLSAGARLIATEAFRAEAEPAIADLQRRVAVLQAQEQGGVQKIVRGLGR